MNAIMVPQCAGLPAADGTTLLGLPAEKSAKQQLSGSAGDLVVTLASILDQMVIGVIEKRTAQEFKAAFEGEFPAYMRLMVSLSSMISAIVPFPVIARLSVESLSELEADIRDHALASFGADMRDRAIFTVWTLRKITDLLNAMSVTARLGNGDLEKDAEFRSYFLFHALRARFSIDCLTVSMRFKRSIYPEGLPVIADGLRSTVHAYAWIKQAADLRTSDDLSPAVTAKWDEEDQDLVNESMHDLAHESL